MYQINFFRSVKVTSHYPKVQQTKSSSWINNISFIHLNATKIGWNMVIDYEKFGK